MMAEHGKVWNDFGPRPSEHEVDALVERLMKQLRGKPPLLTAAALADVVSMFFAGHHPELRQHAIDIWTKTMVGLIEGNENAILKHYGLPEGWDTKQ